MSRPRFCSKAVKTESITVRLWYRLPPSVEIDAIFHVNPACSSTEANVIQIKRRQQLATSITGRLIFKWLWKGS